MSFNKYHENYDRIAWVMQNQTWISLALPLTPELRNTYRSNFKFAVLAILISCLGLFGLAAHVSEQCTKEIDIRKVLGASVNQLWQLLSKDFMVLVCSPV